MHILHLPRFWKHKETKEVIDHLTYSDLKGKPESSDFNECDVTGNLLTKEPEAVAPPIEETPPVETPNETPYVAPANENGESFVEPPIEEPVIYDENTIEDNAPTFSPTPSN